MATFTLMSQFEDPSAQTSVDPYSDAYTQPVASSRDQEPNPHRSHSPSREQPASYNRPSTPPKRPAHAPIAPNPCQVLGIFGLSIRTTERDLDDEFSRYGRVEKVVIVYDQRSARSRGFGFITMSSVEEAARCIEKLNGIELNGRRIRVDYSVTDRPHAPTPGEYMGHRRRAPRNSGNGRYHRDRDDRDHYRDSYRDRSPRRVYERDRDRYGRDNRDWRDRRSPSPVRGGGRGYSPDYRRRRSYSRSPPRRESPSRYRDPNGSRGPSLPPANSPDPRW